MSDQNADYEAAIACLTGRDKACNPAEGAKLMQRSADQGYLPAIRDLGILYINGDAVDRDLKKGQELLLRATKEMDPRAMYQYGLLLKDGVGVPKDLYEARRLIAFAAGMNVQQAAEDAEKIEQEIDEQRKKNLSSRPLLRLELSERDIEACCCDKMFNAVLNKEIYHVESFRGPVLMTEDESGEEVLLTKCPFCGAVPEIVPVDKIY